jgi:carbamoyltransferase
VGRRIPFRRRGTPTQRRRRRRRGGRLTAILGLSAFYHDSAAALVVDGDIVAAAQEERFSRKKHDARFPAAAIRYCLAEAKMPLAAVDAVVFYDKPFLKFERLLETYLAFAPSGFRSFVAAMPVWLREKLLLKSLLKKELARIDGGPAPALKFAEHHESHAASAFYPSPYERAAVLCLDGVGEWATSSVWLGEGNRLTPLWEIDFPHSLGLLYSAFTYYCGFKVNSGEYKLMGLAPYGEPRYVDLIYKHLIDVKPDGTYRLDMRYFNYATGLTMTNARFDALFGKPPRTPDTPILDAHYMDVARSIQQVTEEVVLKIARSVQAETKADHLCLAGGVALNCVANGRLLREGPFKDIWIQPAAGDAGGAVGAALAYWHEGLGKPRTVRAGDAMRGSYLGPTCEAGATRTTLARFGAQFDELADAELMDSTARRLAAGEVVGWVSGRMEFGPRALGGRSILGDPRDADMQRRMNVKIKFRESFRPFAPSVLGEKVATYFELDRPSPYMLLVAPVAAAQRLAADAAGTQGIERLKVRRSTLPAITHVDCSARIQTVHADTNPRYHALLTAFEKLTGCGALVNTSFNVRGEPIVCTAEDAYRCFMRCDMDTLVIGNFVLEKKRQPEWKDSGTWRTEFEPD